MKTLVGTSSSPPPRSSLPLLSLVLLLLAATATATTTTNSAVVAASAVGGEDPSDRAPRRRGADLRPPRRTTTEMTTIDGGGGEDDDDDDHHDVVESSSGRSSSRGRMRRRRDQDGTYAPTSSLIPTIRPIPATPSPTPAGVGSEPPASSPPPTDVATPRPTDPPAAGPTEDGGPTPEPSYSPTDPPTVSPAAVIPTTTTGTPTTASPTAAQPPAAVPTTPPPTAAPPPTTPVPSTDWPTLPAGETGSPAAAPTIPPTVVSPSVSPTTTPTTTTGGGGTNSDGPTSRNFEKSLTTTGLTLTLYGIGHVESESEWEDVTSGFFRGVYYEVLLPGGGTSEIVVLVKATGVVPVGGGKGGRDRRGGRRVLQSEGDASVVVTYDQETWYRTDDPDWEPYGDYALLPLSTDSWRDEYVGRLKDLGGYEDLTAVSAITVGGGGDDEGGSSGGGGFWTTGAIAGVAVGGAVALLAAIVAGMVRYNKGHYDGGDDGDAGVDRPPEVLEYRAASQPDGRTWATSNSGPTDRPSSSFSGPASSSSVNEFSYENQTVGTMDYDYAVAYGGIGGGGGAGDHSLSDAGGTLGSRTRQTGADGMEEEDAPPPTMMMAPPSGSGGNTVFSEDPTFDQVYEDVREILLDVYAPAGKLGVVIDTPNDGAPMIHAVKETSPIVDKVRVGDKLVAVDDVDVRAMTAMKVSKLISKKGNNPSRKLTIIRHERGA